MLLSSSKAARTKIVSVCFSDSLHRRWPLAITRTKSIWIPCFDALRHSRFSWTFYFARCLFNRPSFSVANQYTNFQAENRMKKAASKRAKTNDRQTREKQSEERKRERERQRNRNEKNISIFIVAERERNYERTQVKRDSSHTRNPIWANELKLWKIKGNRRRSICSFRNASDWFL